MTALDTAAAPGPERVALRPPDEVMRLARLGSFHPSRLSFLRALLRRMQAETWTVELARTDLDARGLGELYYRIATPHGTFSFVAFGHDIEPSERTDRVIARRWDFTFALLRGEPDAPTLDRLRANVPLQEAGRSEPQVIVLSRANKSVRLFDSVVAALAAGEQPSPGQLAEVGYLLRTTAVYGNGKFGICDYDALRQQPPFERPFAAQMFCVYMAKQLGLDVVEHMAAAQAPATAVRLDRRLKRYCGVGNSTGLGMAPFLVKHPRLVHRWVQSREIALARVRAVPADGADRQRLTGWLARAAQHAHQWPAADPIQAKALDRLRQDLAELPALVEAVAAAERPWDALMARAAAELGLEAQELLASLLIELYPERVDDLVDRMAAPPLPALDPGMAAGTLRRLIAEHYAWAFRADFERADADHHFWYQSADKAEPRLGVRGLTDGADKALRLGIAQEVRHLDAALAAADRQLPVGRLVLAQPELRLPVQRVQGVAGWAYGEIRDNLLAPELRPVDMMRAKLAFFGATKFDPKSDRWTRVTLFQGAPLPDELDSADDADLHLPVQPEG